VKRSPSLLLSGLGQLFQFLDSYFEIPGDHLLAVDEDSDQFAKEAGLSKYRFMNNPSVNSKNWQSKLGIVLTGLISVPFVMSAAMKFKGGPEMAEGWKHFGWPEESQMLLGALEMASVLLYMIPKTTFLGAILLTGYLGGAIATHLRLNEAVPQQVVFGVVIWGALYLRDERLRSLLPFRR
jgi:hypothetical protein